MHVVDWIGFFGVILLLAAYFTASFKIIKNNGAIYIVLNCLGAFIACIASVLLHYIPFILLEGAWFIIAIISLVRLKDWK